MLRKNDRGCVKRTPKIDQADREKHTDRLASRKRKRLWKGTDTIQTNLNPMRGPDRLRCADQIDFDARTTLPSRQSHGQQFGIQNKSLGRTLTQRQMLSGAKCQPCGQCLGKPKRQGDITSRCNGARLDPRFPSRVSFDTIL